MGTTDDKESDEFPPEKRLEAPNTSLIKAGIKTIPDMETLRECVAYENAHQNRTQILRRLKWKAEELREDEG
ncbi:MULTISPECIES: hypothetical protein [Halobacteriales]|uniref:DUF8129 domain-containing protein n=1 Tax=Halorubrum glutamatedens TaxID=2707018 RepID=A0ABD5QTU8_9EURY|nr:MULTISPECIES: hypothetical protein [Haloferacales]RDZ56232.1 hypothetical protein C5B91_19015 [Haloferax sp. Atlit-10N]TKX79155.1 hypothetical protein EXE53_17405 [Halorubrum sp. SD626R]